MDYIDNLIEMAFYEDNIEDFKERIEYNKLIELAFEDIKNIEITPQQIQEFANWANSLDIINEDFQIINESKLDIVNGKNGQVIKNNSNEIANIIKKEGITKESKEKISSIFKKMIDSIDFSNNNILNISDSDKQKLNKFSKDNIKKAFLLFAEVLIISTAASIILNIVLGPLGGKIIIGIIGPIIEELAKAVAVKGKYAVEYQTVFNLYEGIGYIGQYMSVGISFKNALIARASVAGMHVTTTVINWITSNPKIQEKLGIKSEDAKKRISFIGHLVGIIIHCGWNLSAIKNNGDNAFNKALLGLDK